MLNEINHRGKGDSAYTLIRDVEREMAFQKGNLVGKIVYCNCDDHPNFSAFCKYFSKNFDAIGLSGLLATYLRDGGGTFEFKPEYGDWVRIGGGTGRFQDSYDIMSKCDVVVTNPPYSNKQARELISACSRMGKDFIIVGPNYIIFEKEYLDMFKDGRLNAGYTNIGRFDTPSGIIESKPTMWWTSFDVPKMELKELKKSGRCRATGICTLLDDGTLFVGSYKDIPDDYDGPISAPYSFCQNINKDEFNILDARRLRLIIQRKGGKSFSFQDIVDSQLKDYNKMGEPK